MKCNSATISPDCLSSNYGGLFRGLKNRNALFTGVSSVFKLFELNRRRRFARQVIHDSVDTLYLVNDTACNLA